MDEGFLLLVVGAVVAGAVLAALAANRFGFPLVVAFLALGMLLGSDGPGGIYFDDAELARTVGIVGLVAILFEGGLSTSWRRLREVAVPAALLSTVGVVVTALLTGVAAYVLFDFTWLEAVLLGAIVASTDAAAVFATLRFTHLRRRVARTLEGETGGNDPVAIALVVGLVAWIEEGEGSVLELTADVVRELAVGAVVGAALAFLASRAFERMPQAIGPFAPAASVAAAALAFGVTDTLGGSGFLAVYLVGLAIGSTPSRFRRQLVAFHEGLAFLAQVAMFIVLGLLVFPSDLPRVAVASLALTAILIFVVRPVAVWASVSGFGFSLAERLLLGWAGLRGAVPIVLGTFALSAGLERSETMFNAVFFVVLVSTLLQGTTLEWVARRLGVTTTSPRAASAPLEVGAPELDLVDFTVSPDHAIAGVYVRELGLPRTALVAVVLRDGEAIPPRGGTRIEAGDRLYVLVPHKHRRDLDDVFARWRRRI